MTVDVTPKPPSATPMYIGDGVYAEFDGYQIWVWTQEGDRIALEPAVMLNLVGYAKEHMLQVTL